MSRAVVGQSPRGSATMAPGANSETTTLSLSLANATPGGVHPWEVRHGQCGADEGKRIPLDVSEGDEVLYSKYGGTEIKVEGEDLLVLRESDVLAKVV